MNSGTANISSVPIYILISKGGFGAGEVGRFPEESVQEKVPEGKLDGNLWPVRNSETTGDVSSKASPAGK